MSLQKQREKYDSQTDSIKNFQDYIEIFKSHSEIEILSSGLYRDDLISQANSEPMELMTKNPFIEVSIQDEVKKIVAKFATNKTNLVVSPNGGANANSKNANKQMNKNTGAGSKYPSQIQTQKSSDGIQMPLNEKINLENTNLPIHPKNHVILGNHTTNTNRGHG